MICKAGALLLIRRKQELPSSGGPDQQRWKTTLKKNNIDTKTILFAGDYEKVTANGITQELYYIGDKVLFVKQAGQPDKIYCLIKDHIGSIVKIVDNTGATVFAANYDVWGNRTVTNNTYAFHRGFTGHEHLPEFNLINMNGRVYDPILGRFLSPDPFVQASDLSRNFNRYSYCLNNPLIYTDPGGENWWKWWIISDLLTGGMVSATVTTAVPTTFVTAAGTADALTGGMLSTTYLTIFPFTNQGYEAQKYISPIAFKPDINFGSIQNGIGFDASIGMLKGSNGIRYHYGKTRYWSSYGGYSGWETRNGWEFEVIPFLTYSTTRFSAGEFSQTTGNISLGDPFTSMSYENDWMFGLPGTDNGDRWRTAAVGMNFGPLSVNLNMFTGDAGPDRGEHWDIINGHKTYVAYDGYDPNKYRSGVLSLGFGPIRFGKNSEGIRKVFQNQFAHDILTGGKSLWFEVLPIPASWYWSFGFGTGDTLW